MDVRPIKSFQDLRDYHFTEWLKVMADPQAREAEFAKLIELKAEVNSAIQHNAALADKAGEAQREASAKAKAELAEIEDARGKLSSEKAALDRKRERWETDEAKGKAAIAELKERIGELEQDAAEVEQAKRQLAEFRAKF